MRRFGVYRAWFWLVLRHLPPEWAHHTAFATLRALVRIPGVGTLLRWLYRVPSTPVHALGMTFPSPLGLAAGFDKDARGVNALAALGFGFVEVGTITAQAQPGNPKPRLFRLTNDAALINRFGFNNEGAQAAATRLAKPRRCIVGVNIGKTKLADDAIADYVASTTALAPVADYLVVNVSSPNTPGLRSWQAREQLLPLLAAVRAAADRVVPERRVPLLVKIAPDLTDEELHDVADVAIELRLDGIIATNTTLSRDGLVTPKPLVEAIGAGGLSGRPLRARALAVLAQLRGKVGPDMVLIAAGGIESGADVHARLAAGATLVQAYTGFVYGGPGWPSRVQIDATQLTAAARTSIAAVP